MAALPDPSREAAERLLTEVLAPQLVRPALPSVKTTPISADRPVELKRCDQHGEYPSRGIVLMGGRTIWPGCPACEEEAGRAEAAAAAAADAARRAAIQERRLGEANIPPRFAGRDFAGYKAESAGQMAALTIARDFVERWPANKKRGLGLVFSGLPGTGKSHLAAAILAKLATEHAVKYTTCMGLIRLVRDTWRRDSLTSESSALRELCEVVDLLVIDEVGLQYGTEGEQTILSEVLDRRYCGMRPTILLTNQGPDGLKAYLGDRAYDRLTETSRWVTFGWASYRPQARQGA